jgi:uncharacterized protein (TIGR03382 family)
MRPSILTGLSALIAAAAPALAGLNGAPLTIHASGPSGTGDLIIDAGASQWHDGTWYWHSLAPIPILDTTSGATIALLTSCTLTYHDDPMVDVNFTLTGGASGSHFIVSSAQLTFPTLFNPTGNASAGFSTTDSDNAGGSLVTGNYPGGNNYRAFYNGFPGGTTFAHLVTGPVAAPQGGTNVAAGNQPATVIPGGVSDMSAQWDFNISANDSIGATSTFNLVPAPGAGALLALGGLAALRRRR